MAPMRPGRWLHVSMEMRFAPPPEIGMPTFEIPARSPQRTGKHLALGISQCQLTAIHLPINVAEEFKRSAFENVKCRCRHFAVIGFGIAPINLKAKAFSSLPIDGQ